MSWKYIHKYNKITSSSFYLWEISFISYARLNDVQYPEPSAADDKL